MAGGSPNFTSDIDLSLNFVLVEINNKFLVFVQRTPTFQLFFLSSMENYRVGISLIIIVTR